MLKIAIIIGTTRPNRRGEAVAKWTLELANKHGGAEFSIVDLRDYALPLLDEPAPPSMGNYVHEHTKRWSAAVDSFDGYIFVTPEYNHSISGAMKNALDFVYREWNNKVAGFVSYGTTGGVRAVEHLRAIAAEIQIADVRSHVSLSLMTDWVNFADFKPAEHHQRQFNTMLDQMLAWGPALRAVREAGKKAAA
jgi:NAD(P)H-dependent FMN reductase